MLERLMLMSSRPCSTNDSASLYRDFGLTHSGLARKKALSRSWYLERRK